MRKYLIITLLLLNVAGFAQTTYPPAEYNFTLTAGDSLTDSIRVPVNLVIAAIRVLDVTNIDSVSVQYCFDVTPTTWFDVLELDTQTDYATQVADTSISIFDPKQIWMGQGKYGSYAKDYIWIRLKTETTEAGDITITAMFRYL